MNRRAEGSQQRQGRRNSWLWWNKRLGAEADLERDRDDRGEDSSVLNGDSSNKNDDSLIGGISNGSRGLWVGSTTSSQ